MSERSKSSTQREGASRGKSHLWLGWVILVGAAGAVFAFGMLLASVMERRYEAMLDRPLAQIAPLETESRNWAVNWPRQYSSYRQMRDDTTRTAYGGAQPRDYLAETPANVVLFAGYGFAKEYLQARGHVYAIEDVKSTERVTASTPATCWTCKSTDVPRRMAELGAESLGVDPHTTELSALVLAGAERFYAHSFHELNDEMTHPVGCLDCHDPATMRLRITRPALIEALERQGRDLAEVSHQEMRSLVCAQCHVEYYFKGEGNYLTFPWDRGLGIEEMAAYYNEDLFADWTHAISRTPMVKMQHPDYEVYSKGIHAFRKVSCADCHMPYRTEGGMKLTNHHVRSPLLDIATSCAVCHRWSEQETRDRVTGIQDKIREGRNAAEDALTRAHLDIAACMEVGADDRELQEARRLIRDAQMRWDYVAAHNGMGFHAPQECQRILATAVDLAQQSRLASARVLARHGYLDDVAYPDFSTKEKAQAMIRLFIDGTPPTLLAVKP